MQFLFHDKGCCFFPVFVKLLFFFFLPRTRRIRPMRHSSIRKQNSRGRTEPLRSRRRTGPRLPVAGRAAPASLHLHSGSWRVPAPVPDDQAGKACREPSESLMSESERRKKEPFPCLTYASHLHGPPLDGAPPRVWVATRLALADGRSWPMRHGHRPEDPWRCPPRCFRETCGRPQASEPR